MVEVRSTTPRWRLAVIAVVVTIIVAEAVWAWNDLVEALSQLRSPHPGPVLVAVLAAIASMRAYARMQRRLLRSAGIHVPLIRHIQLAYAAHSLSVTLPGGPAFSTTFNYRQMRRFGASSGVASWCIALSGILSATALALISAAAGIAAGGTPAWPTLAGLLTAVVPITAGVARIARTPETLHRITRGGLAGVNKVRRRPREHGVERITGFLDQLRAVRLGPAHATVAVTYAVANWLLDAVCLWMCCLAVGAEEITTTQLLVAYCAGMAAASVPVVPGGLGVIDSALILGLVAGGLPGHTAIAAVVLYRLISLGFIVGAGWIIWLLMRRRTRELNPVS
ncbi:YbhN family protein [Virgisporangium ochraceum]